MEALEKGLLYPYLETPEIFRCPVAKKDELRTYSMTHALNGIAGPAFDGTESDIIDWADMLILLDNWLWSNK